MGRPDLNAMFAHVDDISLNAVVMSLNLIAAVGLSPYANKRTAEALLPCTKSEEMGSMAKKPRLSILTPETLNSLDPANLSSSTAINETSIDGVALDNTTLESKEEMHRRISARARITPLRRSLGDSSKKAARKSSDKSPDIKRFEPGTLIAFGSFMKQVSLSGQFKPPKGNWSPLPPISMKIGRNNANYVHIGEARVLMSGGLEHQVLKRVNIVDLNTDAVSTVPSMVQERFAHASTYFDGLVFVAGGQSFVQRERIHLNSVEKYDVIRKMWTECSPMAEKRSLFALVNDNNNVYALGGMNETVLATVEMYDTKKDEWTQISSMIKPRAALAAAVLKGYIYVMGGGTQINTCETDTVERFDIENGTWSMVATLFMARDYLTATILDDKLVVIGGCDSKSELTALFEVFNEAENTWALGVLCKRSAGGVVFSM